MTVHRRSLGRAGRSAERSPAGRSVRHHNRLRSEFLLRGRPRRPIASGREAAAKLPASHERRVTSRRMPRSVIRSSLAPPDLLMRRNLAPLATSALLSHARSLATVDSLSTATCSPPPAPPRVRRMVSRPVPSRSSTLRATTSDGVRSASHPRTMIAASRAPVSSTVYARTYYASLCGRSTVKK